MVQEGRFREDLYYRLAMLEISLPRLADRREDFPLLERFFIEQFATSYSKNIKGFTRRAQIRMSAYSWPGNVRQLENVIGSACMMTDGPVLDIQDLPEELQKTTIQPSVQDERSLGKVSSDEFVSLDEMQKRYVERVLEHVGGNKARAAEILGIGRATIYHLLSRMQAKSAPELSTPPRSTPIRSR